MTTADKTIQGRRYIRNGAWPGVYLMRAATDPLSDLERREHMLYSREITLLRSLRAGGIAFDRIERFDDGEGGVCIVERCISLPPSTELAAVDEPPAPRRRGERWANVAVAAPPSLHDANDDSEETTKSAGADAETVDWASFVAGLEQAAGRENATRAAHLDRLIGPLRVTGVYTADQMSNEVYHESGALSGSGLKTVGRSIAHYIEQRRNPPKAAHFDVGTAVHDLVLEGGSNFDDLFVMRPDDDRGNFRKSEGKEWRDEQLAAGKRILDDEQYEAVQQCAASIWEHPQASALLAEGEAEVSYFWEEVVDGVAIPCRARPDWHMPGVVTDLKAMRDAWHDPFARAMVNYGYDMSLAFYCRGIEVVTGRPPDAVFVIAVEKTAPYGVAVYDIGDEWLARGRALYMERLAKVAAWLTAPEADLWTGYSPDVQTLEMPRWARRRE